MAPQFAKSGAQVVILGAARQAVVDGVPVHHRQRRQIQALINR